MADLRTRLDRELETIRPPAYTIADVSRRRERRRRQKVIRTTVAACVIGIAVAAGAARMLDWRRPYVPARPGSTGTIAFVSPGQGGPDDRLYRVAPDGTDLRPVVDVRAEYPAWSPDGSRVAFDDGSTVAIRDWLGAHGHLFLVQADGTGLLQLTQGDGGEFTPTWSPDGAVIAFSGWGQARARPGIFALDVGRGTISAVTANPYDGYMDKEPDFSPDGSRIVFVRDHELVEAGGTVNREALFVVDVDGSGLRRLTPWEDAVGTPAWSPDGSTIVFRSGLVQLPPLPNPRIDAVDADGTHLRALTPADVGSFWPSWSPDGAKIVFTQYDPSDGRFALFTMNPDGSNQVPVTPSSPLPQNEPAWGSAGGT